MTDEPEPSSLYFVTINDTWTATATGRDGTEACAVATHLWELHTGRQPRTISARKIDTISDAADG